MSELKLFSFSFLFFSFLFFSFLFFFSGYLLRWILENKEEKKKAADIREKKKKKKKKERKKKKKKKKGGGGENKISIQREGGEKRRRESWLVDDYDDDDDDDVVVVVVVVVVVAVDDEFIASMGSQPTTTVRNTHIKAAKSYPQLLPRPSKLVESKPNPSPELSIMAYGSVSKSVSKCHHHTPHTFLPHHMFYEIPRTPYLYMLL